MKQRLFLAAAWFAVAGLNCGSSWALTPDEVMKAVEENDRKAGQMLDKADALAEKGDFADQAALGDLLDQIRATLRQDALLNDPEKDKMGERMTALKHKFYDRILDNCGSKPVPREELIKLEAQDQKLGRNADWNEERMFICMFAPWNAEGQGDGGFRVSGPVASYLKPFELQGTFPGGTVTLRFKPADSHGGKVTYQGSGGGYAVDGMGSYTASPIDSVGHVDINGSAKGCVHPMGGCNTRTFKIALRSTRAKAQ